MTAESERRGEKLQGSDTSTWLREKKNYWPSQIHFHRVGYTIVHIKLGDDFSDNTLVTVRRMS